MKCTFRWQKRLLSICDMWDLSMLPIHDFGTKLGQVSALPITTYGWLPPLNAELQHAIKLMQQCDKLCSSET